MRRKKDPTHDRSASGEPYDPEDAPATGRGDPNATERLPFFDEDEDWKAAEPERE
ncbi:MAG: hypothetical protein HC837_20390, partial [Chloroflexaceae bacterium]|nr:hypothetical protein [Chloroflexaceae bacterium]